MSIRLLTISSIFGLCVMGLNGCGRPPAQSESGGHSHSHDHVHYEKGPNGGQVVEIGAKSHHAELVHDAASHKIGVYVLDGDAKLVTPIETKVVTIDISEDEASSSYELKAAPKPGEPEGQTSYFEIVSEPLSKVIAGESEAENVKAELRIQIGERPYVGYIDTDAHEHGHDDEHKEGEA